MRRAAVAVAAAALLTCAPPASAATFDFRDDLGLTAMTAGAFFYTSDGRNQQVVRRMDVATGRRTTVYRPPRGFELDAVDAGGGVLAVGMARYPTQQVARMRVVGIDLASGKRRVLATARQLSRLRPRPIDCGRRVELRDVASDGRVLLQRERHACRRGKERWSLSTHRVRGGERLVARGVRAMGGSETSFALRGGWLLKTGESAARVTPLGTGASRKLLPRRPGGRFFFAALLADDGLVFTLDGLEARGTVSQVLSVRLPGDRLRAGMDLYRASMRLSRRVQRGHLTEAILCGNRLVERRTRDLIAETIVVHDRPTPEARVIGQRTVPRDEEQSEVFCDERTVAIASAGEGPRERLETFALDP